MIKLKWGYEPEAFLIPNAPKFIKCALGENVKQANWGDFNTVRFPQTRMGVEQVFYDGFLRAKAYEEEMNRFNSGKSSAGLSSTSSATATSSDIMTPLSSVTIGVSDVLTGSEIG